MLEGWPLRFAFSFIRISRDDCKCNIFTHKNKNLGSYKGAYDAFMEK